MRISKVYQVSDEEFRYIVASSYGYSDCLRKLKLNTKGGSSTDILKRRIHELNCSIEHFSRIKNPKNSRHSLEDILIEHSTYYNILRLKKRLLDANLLEYKCAECGITEWRGQILSLQLDHINGVYDDHRIENLRLLCPNCHSLTETFAGRNVNKKQK